MKELLLIAVGSAIVNNVVLSQFLGICPFLGVSKKVNTAAGMGGAVIFVITIASFITGLIYKFILNNPVLQKNGIDIVSNEELNKIFFASDEELFNMIGMNKHELFLKYLTRKDKESYIKSLQK